VLGANGGGEAGGTVGSITLADATLTMYHEDAPRGTRAEFHCWGNGTGQPTAVTVIGLLVQRGLAIGTGNSCPRLALAAALSGNSPAMTN